MLIMLLALVSIPEIARISNRMYSGNGNCDIEADAAIAIAIVKVVVNSNNKSTRISDNSDNY